MLRPLLTTVLLSAPAALAAQTPDSTWRPAPERPLRALAQSQAVNLVVNRFDAWVAAQDWARVRPRDWSRNLRLGWEWDENAFNVNTFSHPYHGGLYFNAGRANGLDFWESAPLAFFGSFTWEYFGETYRPSLNDFFFTSFGGIALGETFHRLGASIRDNSDGGGSRLAREIAALPFDPLGGLNRLFRGEWSRRGPNPPEHDPDAFVLRLHAGARFWADSGYVDEPDSVSGGATFLADLLYGDPFVQPYRAPFDVFAIRVQAGPGSGLNQVRTSGRLWGKSFNRTRSRHRHLFSVNQRFDYVANAAHRFGAQSVEAGVYSRWRLSEHTGLRTQFFGDFVMMGALDAPYTGAGERTYDFGPGLGFRSEFTFERRGVPFLTLYGRTEVIHSVSGATADHIVSFGGLEATVPVARGLGLGLHAGSYARNSRYSDRPDEFREFPELRLFGTWTTRGGLQEAGDRGNGGSGEREGTGDREIGGTGDPGIGAADQGVRRPSRSGLWAELGGGPSWIRIACTGCAGVSKKAGSAAYTRVGAVVSRKVLLGVETFAQTNETFGLAYGDTSALATTESIGVVTLWYPWRRGLFLTGGVGLSHGDYTFTAPDSSVVTSSSTGVATRFGIGYDLPLSRRFTLSGNAGIHVVAIGDLVLPSQRIEDVIGTMYSLGVGLTVR